MNKFVGIFFKYIRISECRSFIKTDQFKFEVWSSESWHDEGIWVVMKGMEESVVGFYRAYNIPHKRR